MLRLTKKYDSSEVTMKVRRLIGFFIAIIFVLTTIVAFAAGDSYFVIKDKNGVCKVIKAQEKTSTTIAGPFKTQAEAQNAMGQECPKVSSKPSKSPTEPSKPTAKRSKSTAYQKSCY
jgi:hypothetical protein